MRLLFADRLNRTAAEIRLIPADAGITGDALAVVDHRLTVYHGDRLRRTIAHTQGASDAGSRVNRVGKPGFGGLDGSLDRGLGCVLLGRGRNGLGRFGSRDADRCGRFDDFLGHCGTLAGNTDHAATATDALIGVYLSFGVLHGDGIDRTDLEEFVTSDNPLGEKDLDHA